MGMSTTFLFLDWTFSCGACGAFFLLLFRVEWRALIVFLVDDCG